MYNWNVTTRENGTIFFIIIAIKMQYNSSQHDVKLQTHDFYHIFTIVPVPAYNLRHRRRQP